MGRRRVEAVGAEDLEAALVADVAACVNDPLLFVRTMFPWGVKGTLLEHEDGPDDWHVEILTMVAEDLAKGVSVDGALRYAVASGHGVGKTALVAWIILWFMSTRPNPQIVVTANTVSQLTTKTWRELAKWHRLVRNAGWFAWSAQKFSLKAAPETWCANAVPWSKERAEAFAGTHETHVLLVFDEASAIEDVIWEVAEGALTTTGAMWFAFGNGTRNTGRFRECFRRFRHRWRVLTVDSRKAKKADQGQINQWVEDYGEDSDFVRVRVKGDFPRAASSQFIGEDFVEAARARYRALLRRKRERMGELADAGAPVRVSLVEDAPAWAPLIMSVDVARFGDDQSVIGLRRGNLFMVHAKYRGKDTQELAALVAEAINSLGPDAVFVDAVGVGGGVVDGLKRLGYEVESVMGSMKPLDETKFFNRRVEMWHSVREWLKDGGIIEDSDELRDDLTGPEYGFDSKSRWQLETKDDMKARGLPSPDVGDCLAMSFFMPVAPRQVSDALMARLMAKQTGDTSHMAH